MVDTLALENLFDAVVARFAAEGTVVLSVFGWRTPAEQTVTARVAWVPGDLAGNLGEVGGAKQPGRNPRPIATLFELFTCTISAFDASAPNDERLQYKATRLLFDAWLRAVYLAARGTFKLKSQNWIIDKTQRRHGTALQVVCAIEAMVPDEAFGVAPADTRAVITVEELDVSETFETDEFPVHLMNGGAALINGGALILNGVS
jgi:hypothetical protein